VQEAHGDRVDAAVTKPAGRGRGLFLVERPQLGAGVIEPAADGADAVRRHDAVGLDPEVGITVAVRHRLTGDLEHELEPLGGDEAEFADVTLEQLVGRDRGAVADRRDRVRSGAGQVQDLGQPGHEPRGRVGRSRRRLGDRYRAGRLVNGDNVGERPAGVDPDAEPGRAHGR
jgi:hypothetical protein